MSELKEENKFCDDPYRLKVLEINSMYRDILEHHIDTESFRPPVEIYNRR